ncbi:surface-adhesin E family protein [Paracidovorax sp. MALMAid1276]|uniref:surface-adhesin E family protein n=1 Tax=Paracidovorax sp. MALMAid1276 TaxID=3411631 RepID=UPI003B9B25C1
MPLKRSALCASVSASASAAAAASVVAALLGTVPLASAVETPRTQTASVQVAAPPPQWFTLTGDRDDTRQNLIEILPLPVEVGERVLLDLRVSRDQMRTSFLGKKYRSYYAKVVVDCATRRAWYLELTYFALPLWVGAVTSHARHREGEAEVLFRDMPSEWARRMVSSACRLTKP